MTTAPLVWYTVVEISEASEAMLIIQTITLLCLILGEVHIAHFELFHPS